MKYFDDEAHTLLIIGCGDTFCIECLQKLYENNPDPKCPNDGYILPLKNSESLSLPFVAQQYPKALSFCDNHILIEVLNSNAKCDYCSHSSNPSWICTLCNKILCSECKDWYSCSEPLQAKNIKCFRNHFLRLTNSAEKFYKRKNKYLCDGCQKLVSGPSAHCRICKVDYCTKCINSLKFLIKNSKSLKCKCNNKVIWKFDGKQDCSSCKKKFSKSGSFFCISCSKNFCIPCLSSFIKIKCFICDSFVEFVENEILDFECDHNFCKTCSYPFVQSNFLLCPIEKALIRRNNFLDCYDHVFEKNFPVNLKCDVCGIKDPEFWNCVKCDFFICSKTKNLYEQSETVKDHAIKCFSNHFLRISSSKEFKPFNCDGCQLSNYGERLFCVICKIEFCGLCVLLLKKNLRQMVFCKCGEPRVIWKYDRVIENCAGCSKKYSKSGSFICLSCSKTYCITCAYLSKSNIQINKEKYLKLA